MPKPCGDVEISSSFKWFCGMSYCVNGYGSFRLGYVGVGFWRKL